MANSRARSSIDVGTVIAGTYTIECLLGRGGMGAVFLASHKRLPGKRVAIKLLHVDISDDDVVARFRREAVIASQLDHPNIVRVDDHNFTEDGTPYLVLEYLEGENLGQRLARGPLPLEQAMSILRMVGSAIAAAHREGIIHRDLKPQNIFLVPSEVDGQVVEVAKVLDFGISKMRNSSTVKTQESTLLGTPQYMAPEQATGRHAEVDERTDLFALGAILHEMLCGKPAFTGASIPEVVFKVVYEQPAPLPDSVPGHVADAIAKAMAKPASDRFENVSAFVAAVTGRPLVQRHQPSVPSTAVGEASGPVAAYAATVDSGTKGVIPPVAAPVPVVGAAVQTVVSHAGQVMVPTPARPSRSSRGLVIGVGIAAIAAAALVTLMATSGSEKPGSASVNVDQPIASVEPRVETHSDEPRIEDTAVEPPVVAVIAAPAVDAAVAAAPPDATVKQSRRDAVAGGGATAGAGTVAARSGDPAVWENLDKGEAAFQRGNYDLARQLANSVIDRESRTDAQASAAHFLRGRVHCTKDRNIGSAKGDLRNIQGARLRGALIKHCLPFDIDLR